MREKHENDPVFTEDGKWYFWNENWSIQYGPFSTELECDEALKDYARNLPKAPPG
jgi:hypothetical protein